MDIDERHIAARKAKRAEHLSHVRVVFADYDVMGLTCSAPTCVVAGIDTPLTQRTHLIATQIDGSNLADLIAHAEIHLANLGLNLLEN